MSTLSGTPGTPQASASEGVSVDQGLKPVLGLTAVILLTLSCVTPASSLFIIVPELLASQGSGVVLTLLVGVLVSVAVGICYSELGTRTPSSGGEYAMITHSIGRPAGWLTFALTLVMLIVIPPVIALGTADYLAPIVGLDRATTGAVVMLLATATGILDIKANAYVTGAFLAVETVAAGAVAWLGFTNAERGVDTLWQAQVSDGSALSPFTAGILLSGLGIAIFTCSGFTTATYLAEEMVEPRRNVKWAVLGSLVLGAAIIIVPTIATVLGVGSLNDLATGTYPEFITGWADSRTSAAISVGIAVAILNAVIVMVIQNARVIYATGRDKSWPEPVNKALTRLHPRFGSPVVATLVAGVPGALLAWRMDIESLLGITSVVLASVYLLVAVAVLFVRRSPHAGWKMPLWPLAPVVVIVGVGYALRESAMVDVLSLSGLLAVALAYYAFYLRPRSATHFLVDARSDVE